MGIDTSKIRMPEFLLDALAIRCALADYMDEIELIDREFGKVLKVMEKNNLIENTIIIYTSDNEMPLPMAKAKV